jgi:putative two-component system response regulator
MDSKLKKHYAKEIDAPFNDCLTGLFNHGFFQIALEGEVKRSQRYGYSFTLALVDIDSFSLYNKQRSHVQGDYLLKKIARLIKKNLRKSDLAARFSGDVFALILTKSQTDYALAAMERIRKAAEKLSDEDSETSTVSIGMVSHPRDATHAETLIEMAQEALRKAKARGKNRIHFFQKEKIKGDWKPKILVVDDDPKNIKLLEAILLPLNFNVIKASDGAEAVSIVNHVDTDMVLMDIMMPKMDGYEACRRLKGSETTRLTPVVMVTALDDMDAKIKSIEAGADDFITKPPNKLELLARTKSLINVKKLNNKLISIEDVLFSLANAVEAKDTYTQGHIWRVSNLAIALGKKVGLPVGEIDALRLGGILHDIGKIGVPGEILNKPAPLSDEEWKVIRTHPITGFKICKPLGKTLGPALEVIRHHHEKLDGSGYPDGLKGEEISKVARIMSIVDIYDSLITDRPYRKRIPKKKVIGILLAEADEGKLDKYLVKVLIKLECELGGDHRSSSDSSQTEEEMMPEGE